MTVILRGGSPSLYWVKNSTTGGLRCMVRAYLTISDYVYWWNIPTGQLKGNFIYGKDLKNALQEIRQAGTGTGSSFVRFINTYNPENPSEDQYDDNLGVRIYGARMSLTAGFFQRCQFTQNNGAINVAIPTSDPSILSVTYTTLPRYNNTINSYNYSARDESNALCSFTSNSYAMPTTFFKE